MSTSITANGINFPNGSAGTPSVAGSDTDTGLFYGTDIVGFATGGSERLRIDASGNINIANDSGKLQLGTGADLQSWHNGTHSLIKNNTGRLYVLSDDVWFKDKDDGDLHAKFVHDGAVELYYDNSKKLETTSYGVLMNGHTNYQDNQKIRFGAGEDLQIHHDGSNSKITNSTGHIIINSDSLDINNAADNETLAKFDHDGGVELYYNGTKKLETTSAGGTLTGTWSGVGKILQVISTVKSDTFSTSSSSWTLATGMSVAITPSSSSNKILVILDAKIGAGHEDAAFAGRLMRDKGGSDVSAIYVGDSANDRTLASFGTSRQSGNAGYDVLQDRQAVFLDSPNTSSEVSYKLQVRCNNSRNTYVNRTHDDSNDDDTPRTASSITVMEVAA